MSLKNSLRESRNTHARIAFIASRVAMTGAGCVSAPKPINAKKTVENKRTVCFSLFLSVKLVKFNLAKFISPF